MIVAAILLGGILRESSIDLDLATRYFKEAAWASQDDAGALWGKPLYGPTMFVVPETGEVVANQPDLEGNLKSKGTVFIGKVPSSFAAANTAKLWAGVNWSVIMWPLPSSTVNRLRLIMHESWHRIQSDIGLPSAGTKNDHLDTQNGRTWMLLEYRALSRALPAWGEERKQAVTDALVFRAYRRSLFPGSEVNENRMEVHEGMAEYTGLRLSGLNNSEGRYYLSGRLKLNELKPSLTYAFAYETGPAYGLLLDQYKENWRKELTTSSSLSSMMARLAEVKLPLITRTEAERRAKAYDGVRLIRAEQDREAKRKKQEWEYRQLLITGSRLHLPTTGNFTFDPNAVFPLPGTGNVYVGSKLAEDWGILETDGPLLIGSNYQDAWVPAPQGNELTKGHQWKLSLNPGWKVVAGNRPGDYEIRKE